LPYFPTTLALRLYRLYHRHGGYVASRGTVLHPPVSIQCEESVHREWSTVD